MNKTLSNIISSVNAHYEHVGTFRQDKMEVTINA